MVPADGTLVVGFIRERWGGSIVVAHGRVCRPADLPGLAAVAGERPVGLPTYEIRGDTCEVVTLDSLDPGQGIGSRLLEAVAAAARAAGCARLFLITTNDNLPALRFTQKRGFRLAGLRISALDESRRLKPAIGLVGDDGIPVRDEIELCLSLA